MALVSVIVPIYNSEKYLEKCLQSLVDQTLKDIEILAINDGSTDGSCKILNSFEKKYPHKIKVYHQNNAGISITRNRGLSYASGKYVTFIDSDDSVDLEFCEKMFNQIEKNDLDMVVCDYYEIDKNSKKIIQIPKCNGETVFEKPELLFEINTSPWNKLYKKEFLYKNAIVFPEQLKYEDAVFLQMILAKKAKIGSVHYPLVNYLVHPGSESTVVKKNVFDIFKVLEIVYSEYQKVSKEEFRIIEDYLEYFVINRITVYNMQQIYQEEKNLINSFIEKGFAFLNEKFPYWRKNKLFNENNNFVKRVIKKNIRITKAVVLIFRKNNIGV